MLGLRLEPALASQLDAFAKQSKRTRSSIARDAVREYLDRHSLEVEMKRQLHLVEAGVTIEERARIEAETDDRLRALDEEDGGYDWGPEGPPV